MGCAGSTQTSKPDSQSSHQPNHANEPEEPNRSIITSIQNRISLKSIAVKEDDLPHVFKARYSVGKVLGKGAFATVKLAKNKTTGVKCAVKIVDRTALKEDDEQGLRQEVSIMKSLNHPNIVRLLDFFEEPNFYYLVLELMEGGELFDRVVKQVHYTEKKARDTVKIIVTAIKFCHDQDIVHRDLKPENLLLKSKDDDADLKIADFGFAKIDSGSTNNLSTQCGTPAYIAPEILGGHPYGKTVDMWSIGVITYILLGGYPPFHDTNMKALFKKIKKADYQFHPKYWDCVSNDAKDLIKGLLEIDPEKRLTAGQVLAHPWLKENDEVLSLVDLKESLEEFKKFHASRKFKGAVRSVIMINRLNRMLGRPSILVTSRSDNNPNTIDISAANESDDHVVDAKSSEEVSIQQGASISISNIYAETTMN